MDLVFLIIDFASLVDNLMMDFVIDFASLTYNSYNLMMDFAFLTIDFAALTYNFETDLVDFASLMYNLMIFLTIDFASLIYNSMMDLMIDLMHNLMLNFVLLMKENATLIPHQDASMIHEYLNVSIGEFAAPTPKMIVSMSDCDFLMLELIVLTHKILMSDFAHGMV